MKSILITVVFVFICTKSYSQLKDIPQLALGIEKQFLDSPKEFIFKPNSCLKIKTLDGRKFFSSIYSITEKSIIINSQDTILFENISWIQGNVYNGGGRKALGVAVTLISIPIIFICIGETIASGGVVGYFVSVPFIGMGYGGIKLIGARKFHLSRDCYISAIEQ